MISSQLAELSEDKRVIIRNSINRIRDIANTLSKKSKISSDIIAEENGPVIGSASAAPVTETTLLLPILDSMVTEKRIENRDLLDLNINFEQTKASYGLFSKININEFKRVLSNLINNAVESFPDSKGVIDLFLTEIDQNTVQIIVEDNGKGIPAELIAKLGVRGNTFNKKGGSGLGLAHAKEMLEGFGGTLKVESTEGKGTKIKLELPKEEAPKWFVPKIKIKDISKIIVLDDDQSIHQIWKGRFDLIQEAEKRIELSHFSTPVDLRKYFGQYFAELDDALFLIDFEILNHKDTGLDLIEELGIHGQSILVTSRYEESSLRARCEKLGVKLIPKSMSGFVPIEIMEN